MARGKTNTKPAPPQEVIDKCLAFAVAEGDLVNFRFLFLPYSPLRQDSPENIDSVKYVYLFPEEEDGPRYKEALALAKEEEMRAHVRAQLVKKGPAQLPAEMVMMLADNAVRMGKFTTAAQAYELLRVRRRMQEEFFVQADRALDQNDIAAAVRGYIIGTGLEYDYAAFPEPLPLVPNYQNQALMLHAEYPSQPEQCVALQPLERHIEKALEFLLREPGAAARLAGRSLEQRLAFVVELIRQLDPAWEEFVARYRTTCSLVLEYGKRFQNDAEKPAGGEVDILAESQEQQKEEAAAHIAESLLGRRIENGEWWQYLKELAYEHPAGALFISRQAISREKEIILPRHVKDSELVKRLGLGIG